ncbi:hypothetical protein SNEBB_004316 [Seison nebaliae]|nr:hypothetical protein SNEBB_004316 [Seison nebaliae]
MKKNLEEIDNWKNCAVLNGDNEMKEIILVGTIHFSTKSSELVEEILNRVNPSVIMVELCDERSTVLYSSNDDHRSKEKYSMRELYRLNLGVTDESSKLKYGLVIFKTVMSMIVQELTEVFGLTSGGEFRAAYRYVFNKSEVEKNHMNLENFQRMNLNKDSLEYYPPIIIFGDRNINITLSRILLALSKWQLFVILITTLIDSYSMITNAQFDKLLKNDIANVFNEEIMKEQPELVAIFLTERNHYMFETLLRIKEKLRQSSTDNKRIVCIMGACHLSGVKDLYLNQKLYKTMSLNTLNSLEKKEVLITTKHMFEEEKLRQRLLRERMTEMDRKERHEQLKLFEEFKTVTSITERIKKYSVMITQLGVVILSIYFYLK